MPRKSRSRAAGPGTRFPCLERLEIKHMYNSQLHHVLSCRSKLVQGSDDSDVPAIQIPRRILPITRGHGDQDCKMIGGTTMPDVSNWR